MKTLDKMVDQLGRSEFLLEYSFNLKHSVRFSSYLLYQQKNLKLK